jgi:hypothetical protein
MVVLVLRVKKDKKHLNAQMLLQITLLMLLPRHMYYLNLLK